MRLHIKGGDRPQMLGQAVPHETWTCPPQREPMAHEGGGGGGEPPPPAPTVKVTICPRLQWVPTWHAKVYLPGLVNLKLPAPPHHHH
jgi:hypothetical protein